MKYALDLPPPPPLPSKINKVPFLASTYHISTQNLGKNWYTYFARIIGLRPVITSYHYKLSRL